MPQAEFSIVAMCRLLRVSRGGYYAWRDRLPSQRSVADRALLVQIKTIHAASREVYGAPRIPATLRERGIRISRRRVARLMLQQGLRGVCRRRRKGKPKRPNQLWVADATYIPTSEGTLYLAAIQDVFFTSGRGVVHVC